MSGVWNEMLFEVPSNPNQSVSITPVAHRIIHHGLKSPLHSPQQPQPALSPPSNWPVIVSGIFSSMKPERKWNESAYRKNPYCSNKTQIHNLPTGNLWKEIFALFHNAWGRCWNADPCGGLKKNIINPVLESSNELLLAAFTAARVFFNISETVSPHGHAGWV